ncbi:hypothetical protein YC2023_101765 [Brassica napus]
MAEYDDGKLVILYMLSEKEVYHTVAKSVRCMLVSLHRSGDMICGTVDWSGTMGTVTSSSIKAQEIVQAQSWALAIESANPLRSRPSCQNLALAENMVRKFICEENND